MEVDLIICNSAEVAEGKLYVLGGGVNISWVSPVPPQHIQLGVGLIVEVPYTATNQNHTVKVELLDADGHLVVPTIPGAPPDARVPGVTFEMPLNVGRPAGIPVGMEQSVPLAANLGIPLGPGRYEWVVSIDGTPVKHKPHNVLVQPQPPQIRLGGASPTDPFPLSGA